jgi:hypothetical protein
MVNLIRIPPADHIGELLRLAPRFAESLRFTSMDAEDRRSPYIVFGAFCHFMEDSLEEPLVLDECRLAIEWFASRDDDAEGQNLVITEIFETFDPPETLKNLLHANSRALYYRWLW